MDEARNRRLLGATRLPVKRSEEWRDPNPQRSYVGCDLFVPTIEQELGLEYPKWAPQEARIYCITSRACYRATLDRRDDSFRHSLSHVQSSPIRDNGITRELLVEPLVKRVPRKILPGLIRVAGEAGSYRYAEQTMLALAQYFSLFTAEEAQALAEASVSNSQIWSASLCRIKYLPEFILVQGSNLKPETLRALQYQVENDQWYPRGAQVEG